MCVHVIKGLIANYNMTHIKHDLDHSISNFMAMLVAFKCEGESKDFMIRRKKIFQIGMQTRKLLT